MAPRFSKRLLLLGTSSLAIVSLVVAAVVLLSPRGAAADTPSYDISTLAGKVASLNGTAGLQIRFSAFIEQEAEEGIAGTSASSPPINPNFVQSSPLDGSSIAAPDVTVNQDTAAASQNETAIAVDPNNP